MDSWKYWSFFLIFNFISLDTTISTNGNSDTFGTYFIMMNSLLVCRERQIKTISQYQAYIKNGSHIAVSNLTISEDIKVPVKETLKIWIFKDGKFQKLTNAENKNICLAPAAMRVIHNYVFNIVHVGSSCIIKAGNKYAELDPTFVAHSWIGRKFFYGKIRIRITYSTRSSSLVCLDGIGLFQKPT